MKINGKKKAKEKRKREGKLKRIQGTDEYCSACCSGTSTYPAIEPIDTEKKHSYKCLVEDFSIDPAKKVDWRMKI